MKTKYQRHKNKILAYQHRNSFGGNRDAVLKRDNYCCVDCGISQTNHYRKFGRDISVDHIDRDRKNNSMRNLQTLCIKCHGKKDANSTRRKGVSSRFRGVWKTASANNPWASRVYFSGKRYHVGKFASEEEAAKAWNKMALEIQGKYAKLNQI